MKKYWISKYARRLVSFCLFVSIPVLVLGIYSNDLETIVICTLLAGLCLYQMVFDYPMGTFAADELNVTMKIGFKRYEHSWSDFIECGFVCSYAGGGSIYWVYFSTYHLSDEEKRLFMRKTRRDLNRIAYLQYKHKSFGEISKKIPDMLVKDLLEEEREIHVKMNWLEKIYH